MGAQGREVEILHGPKVLLPSVSGAVLVLDTGQIEPGDLVFLGGHLVRRVVTAPRDRRVERDFYEYDVVKLDGTGGGRFRCQVGQALLVLRPVVEGRGTPC